MTSPLKTSPSKHHQRHSEATVLRGFMDRKFQNFTWPYSYPPFPSPPWFSVNGVTTCFPSFPQGAGGGENIGVPVFPWPPVDPRSMPGGANPRQQNASQAQPEANAASTAAAAQARSSASASDSANRNASNSSTPRGSALVPSRPSSPMTVDAAMQCLSGQLHDAIRMCTGALAEHAKVVATAKFTTPATRNGMWRDLLEYRFKSSGFAQDGFRNLGQRLTFYMEQAHHAVQHDLVLAIGEAERRREAERRVRRLRVLKAECEEIVSYAGEASRDAMDCREMLGLMKQMQAKLGGRRGGAKGQEQEQKQGNEGEDQPNGEEDNGDDVNSGESWQPAPFTA